MKSLADHGYNERLFSGGVRARLHLARFHWVREKLAQYECPSRSILELGCFDGKLIDFLPAKPSRYVGFDADWEGGLELAAQKWAAYPQYVFHKAFEPRDMRLDGHAPFDLAVSMETLEHVPPELVDGYLGKIAEHLDGLLLITVPNEKGVVFLAKWMAKKLLSSDAEPYSASEIVNATLGRMQRVARHEHKGFDYERLVCEVERHFDIIEVSGHPLGFLPRSLCFGIGIVARSKHRSAA